MEKEKEKLERKYYTTQEVLYLLQICRRTLFYYMEKGLIKGYKTTSRKLYFAKKDIDKFIGSFN